MLSLHDADLKGIYDLKIVEIGDQKYVNLTCPQIAILLTEIHPYHETLHTKVSEYQGKGISIGYTENVRASVEKFIHIDLNDKEHIDEVLSLAAPMLNSWDLIEPMSQFFGVKYKVIIDDKSTVERIIYNTPESIQNIPEAGTKMNLPEFLELLNEANETDYRENKAPIVGLTQSMWTFNNQILETIERQPYADEADVEILAKGQCPDSVIERYMQGITEIPAE